MIFKWLVLVQSQLLDGTQLHTMLHSVYSIDTPRPRNECRQLTREQLVIVSFGHWEK